MTVPSPEQFAEVFGGLDIYLFDQLLRGRITSTTRVLDAGCGPGRNMTFLLRAGVEVSGIDADAAAVTAARAQALAIGGTAAAARIVEGRLDALPWPEASFDVVVASAVLHFARDEAHFLAMVHELWRVLAPGGILFCRLASTEGMAGQLTPLGNGRFGLPDGTVRYLVDAGMLIGLVARLGGDLLDPIKTTVVHRQRAMTTWVVRAPAIGEPRAFT